MLKQLLLAAICAPCIAHADDSVPVPRVEVTALRDPEWASYRNAYKSAAFTATFTRNRPLIEGYLQIRPRQVGAPLTGLKLLLAGATTNVEIDVDAIGRATIPMSKAAYDEDAVLRLNRQKGLYYFSGRYSIKERADGVYPLADLRAACEQLISAQRESGYRMRLFGKHCAGIKFSYPASDEAATVEVRQADGTARIVHVRDGHPFEDDSMGIYKVALLRFADLPEHGSVVAQGKPLAIGTVYE
ncbi:hypothetical protein [Massilia sp. S19_KUP03_FR1]|uniref:hypothetical protein n=1 Tax=Massilia sp. S19_KUP03_FR1 TaxID=3025503 RepID=UPI002FCD9F52